MKILNLRQKRKNQNRSRKRVKRRISKRMITSLRLFSSKKPPTMKNKSSKRSKKMMRIWFQPNKSKPPK